MDVAVHVGTLIAVCLFFRAEFATMFRGLGHVVTGRFGTAPARLALMLALATLPAIAFGLGLSLADAQSALRTLEIIGWTTLLGAILLWAADRMAARRGEAESWPLTDAVLMGLAPAAALVPGVSRSGITMTMARLLGFDRTQAARLALMMAVPVILAAGALETAGVVADGNLVLGTELVLGVVLSFGTAWVALVVMMRMFASQWTMLPFVIYRVALGLVLLGIVYVGPAAG